MTFEELIERNAELPVVDVAKDVNLRLRETPRLVVTAPPGAGKSTLLPLTILSDIPEGKVLMLEPRRIAARQVAERLAHNTGERVGDTVGYRVRFETKVSAATRIEVVTEGILERMLVSDPTLEGVCAVIFDEFHERSLSSDLTLALALEAQRIIRPDLRLVIMSATIDTEEICRAFNAPCVECPGQMHEVEIIYGEETDAHRCAEDVARTVARAHSRHEGDILAFLPGQREIIRCQEILEGHLGDTEIATLYGMLSPTEQRRTLLPSAEGKRKIVLATPIAETSLTIEGVRVVVDSGLYRGPIFNPSSGLTHLATKRVTLDMARQRSGRAGRVADGVCYRLWSRAAETRMGECRQPEILEADLASAILSVAAWGESDAMRLPWLTPPPAGHVRQASSMLHLLGAIDDKGSITPHGLRLAELPSHPRISQMLMLASDNAARSIACDIAAILEANDRKGVSDTADITDQVASLREARRIGKVSRLQRIVSASAQYRRLTGTREDNSPVDGFDAGRLLANAFPERVAMRAGNSRYRMAGGDYAMLDESDDLCAFDMLAVAEVDSRIRLAAPLRREDVRALGRWRHNVSWDSRKGRVVARRELAVGTLVVDMQPIGNEARAEGVAVICAAARKEGLTMFDFNDNVRRLQNRIATVAEWHPELKLPNVDNTTLLENAAEWLPLYIGEADCVSELRKIDLCQVIWGMLPYEVQQQVDAIAPSHLRLPCGRNVRIDYRQAAEHPVVSARLQDCFGLLDTPMLDGEKRPVLMELLSPGFKPVQLTCDLRGFWSVTYFEVCKELRRRYPKHRWPDNPMDPSAILPSRR